MTFWSCCLVAVVWLLAERGISCPPGACRGPAEPSLKPLVAAHLGQDSRGRAGDGLAVAMAAVARLAAGQHLEVKFWVAPSTPQLPAAPPASGTWPQHASAEAASLPFA